MEDEGVFQFLAFDGEYPYVGVLLLPWNYCPCILVAASWCLSHTTTITKKQFSHMSIKNPCKVMAGFINTSLQNAEKSQIVLGIEAEFHSNPLVTFVLIKVIPEFQRTLFVDYQQLKYNADEEVNENCESTYWALVKHQVDEDDFIYEYLLTNQIPCPFEECAFSKNSSCTLRKPIKNGISATVVCNNFFMGFAEFGQDNGAQVLYHKITDEVISWIMDKAL